MQSHPVGKLARPLADVVVLGRISRNLPAGFRAQGERVGALIGGRLKGGRAGHAEQFVGERRGLQEGAFQIEPSRPRHHGVPVEVWVAPQHRHIDEPEQAKPPVTGAVLTEINGVEVAWDRAQRVTADDARDRVRPRRFRFRQAFEPPEQLDAMGRHIAPVFELWFDAEKFPSLTRGEREIGPGAAKSGLLQNGIGTQGVRRSHHQIDVADVTDANRAKQLLAEHETFDGQGFDAGGLEAAPEADLFGGLGEGTAGGVVRDGLKLAHHWFRAQRGKLLRSAADEKRANPVALDGGEKLFPVDRAGFGGGTRLRAERGAQQREEQTEFWGEIFQAGLRLIFRIGGDEALEDALFARDEFGPGAGLGDPAGFEHNDAVGHADG